MSAFPQKQTFFEALGLFAKCHKGTFRYSLKSSGKSAGFLHCFAELPTNALCNSVTACAS